MEEMMRHNAVGVTSSNEILDLIKNMVNHING